MLQSLSCSIDGRDRSVTGPYYYCSQKVFGEENKHKEVVIRWFAICVDCHGRAQDLQCFPDIMSLAKLFHFLSNISPQRINSSVQPGERFSTIQSISDLGTFYQWQWLMGRLGMLYMHLLVNQTSGPYLVRITSLFMEHRHHQPPCRSSSEQVSVPCAPPCLANKP